jgi:Zn-dependent peptidase ImmA (M78 family)
MTLPRGFKAEAERTAARLRAELSLADHDTVDIKVLAEHLDVRIVSAAEIVSLDRLEEIESIQAYSFSACTFDVNGRHVIVFNPIRSAERTASDIAHELAHLLLEHDLAEVQYLDGVPFRTCRADEEEQATALGGTILLPRPLLLRAAHAGATIETIAQSHTVTEDMARFRWNTSGVARQVAASRQRKR